MPVGYEPLRPDGDAVAIVRTHLHAFPKVNISLEVIRVESMRGTGPLDPQGQVGLRLSIGFECLACCRTSSGMQKVRCDHSTSAALASLAMDCYYIFRIFGQEVSHMDAGRTHHLKWRGVVVVEGEARDPSMELALVVRPGCPIAGLTRHCPRMPWVPENCKMLTDKEGTRQAAPKITLLIAPLRAEIIDKIFVRVICLEKAVHLVHPSCSNG
jgi:hypothetical protein